MILVLLTRVSQAREREAFEAKVAAGGTSLPTMARVLLVALALLPLAAPGRAGAATPDDALGRLPVQHDGRVMPLDTLARETVWSVTGAHAWKGEEPVATFSSWLFDPAATAAAPIVKVGSKELATAAGLPPGTTHASFEQLVGNAKVMQLIRAARDAAEREMPRRGVLKDAEKLEERPNALFAVLQHEVVRPIPSGVANGPWRAPAPLTRESLASLASGPRHTGWPSVEKIDREILYNRVNPSRIAWVVLLASLAASLAAWARPGRLIDGIAFGLLLLGFAAMTWGIGMRWAAGERVPAANMYESLLFLAWGVGLFAVVAYALLKNRVVVLNAAAMSALTMTLTDLLPMDRFIHPIVPVLSGTPWLAIHVPIIMVGYAVLALGLVVSHMLVGFAAFGTGRGALVAKLYDVLYWYMFVGSIFLLTGILTGSVWAASSWGRYWGWDPKEVWSLVAFLAYMAILHLKVDEVIGTFAVAVVSIAAFQTILMTYLGVNFVLGAGMHSYGMGDSPVLKWMLLVGLAELVFLVVAGVAWRDRKETLAA